MENAYKIASEIQLKLDHVTVTHLLDPLAGSMLDYTSGPQDPGTGIRESWLITLACVHAHVENSSKFLHA